MPNKTDGSLFIYKSTNKGQSTKPDGYYFYEGITFILDAKSPYANFSGQIFDYMKLESNENFIGFEYNQKELHCYVNGKLQEDELILHDKEYYRAKYFPKKINNETIVNKSAKKLANLFRNARVDKQMNVPFIGAVILCMKFNVDLDLSSTQTILNSIKIGINTILDDNKILFFCIFIYSKEKSIFFIFNKFKNVPELSSLYKNVADTVTNSDIMKFQKNFVPKLYNNKPINIITPRSDEVALFIGVQNEYGSWNEGSIIWRMENQSEDIAKNNLLACTTDARKAGLDFRLINPYAKDYEDSKVNILAQNVYEEWKNWEDDKGTQLIFCDLSTPKIHSQNIETNEINNKILSDDFININDELAIDEEDKNMSATNLDEILAKQSKFDVYSDILKKLKNLGIPQHEIRFIHDAKTDLQKAELFADVNSGKVRILIGSTQKMGAGTNVQERIVAIHHLDCPWRPSDLEQRNGRVIRQGNKLFLRNPEDFRIKEFRYATERTYDARMWQVIESKALSIEQFRKADKNTRELEDISSAAADAAEMKAQATGNPLILMQVQLSSDLKQEEILYNSFKKEQFYNEELLKQSKSYIDLYTKEKKILEDIKDTINNHKSEHFSGKFYDYNLDSNEYKTIDFIIRKNDDSPTNKQNQERIKEFLKKGIEIAHGNFATEYKLFEYRGITISLEKTQIDTLNFYINTPKGDFIEHENLVFKNKNSFIDFSNIITLGGLVTRINNFYNGIEERISTTDRKISKLCSEIIALEKITGENAKPYKRYDYLLALREDEKTIMLEIEKMSKSRSYKSNFIPKSQLILKSMDKNEHLECKKEINDINI